MDVTQRIRTELDGSPVVLFMKGTPDFPQCGFSAQTVAALRAVGADFKYVNIFEEPEIREALKRYSNWPTYPQLYVKGELVGGCDIALEMYKSGELKKLPESLSGREPGSRCYVLAPQRAGRLEQVPIHEVATPAAMQLEFLDTQRHGLE